MLKRIAWIVALAVLALAAYLALWPVPMRALPWVAPPPPGHVGAHALNQRLAGLQVIALGGEAGPEPVALGPDGRLYAAAASGTILRMAPDGKASALVDTLGGAPIRYAGAVAVARSGLVYSSDAPTRFGPAEHVRGGAIFADVNAEYPAHGPGQFRIERLVAQGTSVVTEVAITDGVRRATALSFFEVAGARIARLTEYWPEPYAAPASRRRLTEPMV